MGSGILFPIGLLILASQTLMAAGMAEKSLPITVLAQKHGGSNHHLIVTKHKNTLEVLHGDKVVKSYTARTGTGGAGSKRKRGDNMTPVGVYRIVAFNPNSKFHFFMHLNYPNARDAWYGHKIKLITKQQLDSIANSYKKRQMTSQNTRLGGFIGIHGIGEINEQKLTVHELGNWTNGCIALTNEEITELRRYVKLGTQVIIRD
ncbi:MAG: L,D-transpeptidase family protein [Candidatus Eutrophobiaceae bacterium]